MNRSIPFHNHCLRASNMGGPIVRSGASPKFSENWDKIFGGKPSAKKSAPAKSAKKKGGSPKPSAKKSAKKKSK